MKTGLKRWISLVLVVMMFLSLGEMPALAANSIREYKRLEAGDNNRDWDGELEVPDLEVFPFPDLPVDEDEVIDIEDNWEMPAQSFEVEDEDLGVVVTAEAPSGALPANSTMEVYESIPEDYEEALQDLAEEPEVLLALVVVFFNEYGELVHPQLPVQVKVAAPVLTEGAGSVAVIPDESADDPEPKTVELIRQDELNFVLASDELVFNLDSSAVIVALKGQSAPLPPVDEPMAMPAQHFDVTDGDMVVTVDAPENALPAGTTLDVYRVLAEDYQDEVNALVAGSPDILLALNITFYDEFGAEIEPQLPVQVKITAPELEGQANLSVVHIPDAEDPADPETVAVVEPENLDFELGTNEVVFRSDKFSVYAVIGGAALRLTVEFYTSGAQDATLISQQVLVLSQFDDEGEKPLVDPGVPELGEKQSFEGWMIDETHKNLDINGLNAYIHDNYASMTANDTLRVNAMIYDVRYVIYRDQAGAVLRTDSFHVRITNPATGAFEPTTVRISYEYTPFKGGQNLSGWILTNKVDIAGDYPIYKEDVGTIYANNADAAITTADFPEGAVSLDLSPYLKTGAWLIFDTYKDQDPDSTSTSFVPPFFVAEGTVTAPPATPTRVGYTFEGWFTSKSLNTRFIFGNQLNEDTTVYAKWKAAETTYRVNFWQQMSTDAVNAADADKTYANYTPTAVTVVRTAHTGNQVSITEADTRLGNRNNSTTDYGEMGFYFVYNANNSDTDPVTVKGDGSTVLNVYYDRKTITISFYTNSSKTTLATLGNAYTPIQEGETGDYYYYTDPNDTGYYFVGTGPNPTYDPANNSTVYYYSNQSNTNAPSTTYYATAGTSHTISSSNTYFKAGTTNTNTPRQIWRYQNYGTNRYRALFYQYTNQSGYYPVGQGPDPTAVGTHKATAIPNPMTGLYGGPLANWPAEPAGQEWNYVDAEDGNTYGITPRDSFDIPDNKYTTVWDIYAVTPSSTSFKTIHWMCQDLNGNYVEKATSSLGNNVTQYYDDGKFAGFKAKGHNLTSNSTSTSSGFVAYDGSTGISYSNAGQDAYIFFDRNSYELEFISNSEAVKTELTPFEKPLAEYSSFKPTNGEEGYFFDGWYADPGYDTPFDFSGIMPNHAVTVYAKWTLMRFRVVCDPRGGDTTIQVSEITLPNDQATTFRINYGEAVEGTNFNAATRPGYTLLGWFLDTDPDNDTLYDTPFNFSTPMNDSFADMTYGVQGENESDEAYAARRSGVDPWKDNKAYNDEDGEHDDVIGKITIYAKWRQDPDGIIGINVRYDAVESNEHKGYFSGDAENRVTIKDDPNIYADRAQAYAQPASTPEQYDPELKFLYWDILDAEGNSTGRKAYPGQTFEILFADAKEEQITPTTDIEVEPELFTFDRGNLNIVRQGQAGLMATQITAYEPVDTIETGVEYLIGYKDGDTVYLLMNLNPDTNSSYISATIGNTSNVWISYAIPAVTNADGYVIGLDNSSIANATFEHVGWKFVANGNYYIIQNASNSTYHLGLYGTGSSYPDLYAKTNNTYYNQWRWNNSRLSYYASSSTSHYVTSIGSSDGDARYFYAPTSANATYSTLQLYKKTTITVGHTVKFMDGYAQTQIGEDQTVDDGAAAVAPEPPDHTAAGWIFTGWDTDFSYVTSDLVVTAQYQNVSTLEYTVTFRYMQSDGTWTTVNQTVNHGQSATPPTLPTPPAGYTFNSWDKRYDSVTSNMVINAVYKQEATKRYVITLRAVYGRADAGSVTHINWYSNAKDLYDNAVNEQLIEAKALADLKAELLEQGLPVHTGEAKDTPIENCFYEGGDDNKTYDARDGYNFYYDYVKVVEDEMPIPVPYLSEDYEFLGWGRVSDASSIPEGHDASEYLTNPDDLDESKLYLKYVKEGDYFMARYDEYRLNNAYNLVGTINGDNNASYTFSDKGICTITTTSDSYVFVVRQHDNCWFMTDGWHPEMTGQELWVASDLGGADPNGRGNKLFVPGGKQVTFTLTERANGTLFLSYAEGEPANTDETWIKVEKVAANEQKPYHDMYAVWKPFGSVVWYSNLQDVAQNALDSDNFTKPNTVGANDFVENKGWFFKNGKLSLDGNGTEVPIPAFDTYTYGTDGLVYHFLGWATDPDATEPELKWVEGTDGAAGHYETNTRAAETVTTVKVTKDDYNADTKSYTVSYYALWQTEFYIYHSGIDATGAKSDANPALETIPLTRGTFDLASRTTSGMLYGGYYLEGGFTAPAGEYENLRWPKYDGTNWTWTTAQTADGMAMTPVGGQIYVIKEVPADKFLLPYMHYTYFLNDEQSIANAWVISVVDDLNYSETGFVIVTDNEEADGIVKSLKVTAANTGTSITLTPKRVFKSTGYLTYTAVVDNTADPSANLLKDNQKVLQYWITPDGILVTGETARNYSGLTLGVSDLNVTPSTGNISFTDMNQNNSQDPGNEQP